MSKKLYVTNLPPSATGDEIQTLIAQYGQINRIKLVHCQQPDGPPCMMAYVWLDAEEAADAALRQLNGHDMAGHRLAVSWANPPKQFAPPTPEQQQFAQRIAEQLGETEQIPCRQILEIVCLCGETFAECLMAEMQAVEAAGGMVLADGSRRRTPGGVFFKLAKDRMSSKMRWYIFKPLVQASDQPSLQEQSAQDAAPPGAQAETRSPNTSAQDQLAELREAHRAAQQRLEAIKACPQAQQTGFFSAMKHVVDLQRQIEALLRKHPDLS